MSKTLEELAADCFDKGEAHAGLKSMPVVGNREARKEFWIKKTLAFIEFQKAELELERAAYGEARKAAKVAEI